MSSKSKRGKSKGKRSDDDSDDNSDDDSDADDAEDVKECQKGDAVEAKLKGWTKYYKGKITRVNRDGTYDILFDDGERKSKVDAKSINHWNENEKNIKIE